MNFMQYIPPQTTSSTNISSIPESDTQRLSDESVNVNVRAALLKMQLERIIKKNEINNVTTSVLVQDLQTGQFLEDHNTGSVQFAASINKLPIARLVLADLTSGKLKSDQVLSWTASDVRAGAGTYDQPGAPTQATVQDLLFDMLNPSGNTAVRVLVNQGLGGAPAVNDRFTRELGLQQTYLQPQTGNTFYLGNTTTKEASTNLVALMESPSTETAFVKNALATNIYTDYGVRSQLAGNSYITLVNKVGILDDPTGNNRHDVGIIYNANTGKSYAYAFLNTAPGTPSGTATSQAGISVADMGRAVLRYSGDKATKERPLTNVSPFTVNRMRY